MTPVKAEYTLEDNQADFRVVFDPHDNRGQVKSGHSRLSAHKILSCEGFTDITSMSPAGSEAPRFHQLLITNMFNRKELKCWSVKGSAMGEQWKRADTRSRQTYKNHLESIFSVTGSFCFVCFFSASAQMKEADKEENKRVLYQEQLIIWVG